MNKDSSQIDLTPEEKKNLESFSSKIGIDFYNRFDLIDCEEELIKNILKEKKF